MEERAWIDDEVDIYIYTQLYIYIYHTPIYTNIIYIYDLKIYAYIYMYTIYIRYTNFECMI